MSDTLDYHEIATKCNVSYDTVRRTIKKIGKELGIELNRRRNKKGTLSHCLSIEDANKLMSYFETRQSKTQIDQEDSALQRFGYFYIIQLVPEAIPNRVKLGYTDDLNQRLREHQTSAPTSKMIGHWKCKRYWEQAAIDSITRENCKLVLNEVYEGDVDQFIERAKDFFALMPKTTHYPLLSEHSPMKKKKKKA
ncbi:MAG: hypothetical protein PVH61_09085 [Candidatus Aminicenantes bacterium]|jgi:hypothetical protein